FNVNIYIKREFAPLPQRVRAIVAILGQASNVMAAARANLEKSLPRPFVETAIEVAEGSAEFLGKDLVEALKDFKDEPLRAQFDIANEQAIAQLRAYVAWLKQEPLALAHDRYALGRDSYAEMLREGELIPLPPERLLEIGLRELKREQDTFTKAAQR